MFNLTRHERSIIVFLSLSLLLGSGALYYRRIRPRVHLKVLPQDVEAKKILEERKKVNINEASLQELTRLSGIGPVLAKRILDYRRLHGPFKKVEDIKNVEGIGPKKLSLIEKYLILE